MHVMEWPYLFLDPFHSMLTHEQFSPKWSHASFSQLQGNFHAFVTTLSVCFWSRGRDMSNQNQRWEDVRSRLRSMADMADHNARKIKNHRYPVQELCLKRNLGSVSLRQGWIFPWTCTLVLVQTTRGYETKIHERKTRQRSPVAYDTTSIASSWPNGAEFEKSQNGPLCSPGARCYCHSLYDPYISSMKWNQSSAPMRVSSCEILQMTNTRDVIKFLQEICARSVCNWSTEWCLTLAFMDMFHFIEKACKDIEQQSLQVVSNTSTHMNRIIYSFFWPALVIRKGSYRHHGVYALYDSLDLNGFSPQELYLPDWAWVMVESTLAIFTRTSQHD